ncbi:MAG: 4Fe-4S double cluster binding domain-containing protein [Methanosphaera sp.]|nr:4Fe-4S double cluster binding domain-containing protein [Methanosphaera sp.]
MTLSSDLREYLIDNGASKVGYADISDVTIMPKLKSGVVFYVTYPRDILKRMTNAPTAEYVLKLVDINAKLDELGMLCEEYLIEKGYEAYAQTKERLGKDFGEFNSFELPHKTFATKAGLGWIGKSALLTTHEYGSALRLTSVMTDAPLEYGKPILKSNCGNCNQCKDACKAGAISGIEWNYKLKRNDFYNDKKCEEYALKISKINLGKADTVCGKCIYACPYTQRYMNEKK